MQRKVAPYGSWRSPIAPSLLPKGASVVSELMLDGEENYWLRLLPEERGRYALFRKRFSWVRADPWKEGETPFVKIEPIYKSSW
jgi:hypothetical protein